MRIIKREGYSEAFDERKVYASVYSSCINSNHSREKSEQIAGEVTEEVKKFIKNKKEILSFDIRDKIIKELRNIDVSLAFCYSKQVQPKGGYAQPLAGEAADKSARHNQTIFISSLIGVLFSGYLSISRIITNTCPIQGECPYFLGYPACYYGFTMFFILFIASCLLMLRKYNSVNIKKVISFVSLLGIIFSGYFSIKEVFYPTSGALYPLLLPTCVYGFIMYVIIFITSKLKS